MKLATTTGDFGGYTDSQIQALRYIRQAGFQYADYNFGMDYKHRNGVIGIFYKYSFYFFVLLWVTANVKIKAFIN